MKVSELLEYSKPVLAGAVKFSQRKQLIDEHGKRWQEWVQAQPTGSKLSDPKRYSSEQLADFLASLSSQQPDPRAPGKEPLKPQKLLKRYLPWLAARIQQDKVFSGGAAAGKAAAGGKQKKAAKGKAMGAAADSSAEQQAAKPDPVRQLMQRTRAHPRFHHWYNFESFEKGWVCTSRSGDGQEAAAGDDEAAAAAAGPGPWRLLGVDCEMCVTSESEKELLQLAVVDEDENLLIQELVVPATPVLDFRTDLTGITAADLQGVTLTRKAAAKRLAKLLTPTTVLVGHGLHHDLQALQLDHAYVIDTSMIFQFKGLSSYTPSLALLSEQLLQRPLRGRDPSAPVSTSQQQPQHDSREDASVSLALVQMELQRGTPTPPLDPPELKVDKADLCKLCVHRLPGASTSSGGSSSLDAVAASVKASLAAACKQAGAASEAAAVESAATEQQGSTGKQLLYLVFKHAGEANEVFAALPGTVFTDSVGRHSKHQQLQGSSHKVILRKMACHGGLAFGKDKAADRGAKAPHSKKRKAPNAGGKQRKPQAAGQSKKPKKA